MAAALTITANSNDAMAALAALERKYDALEQKIKRLGTASKQAAKDANEGWNQFNQNISNIAGNIGTSIIAFEAVKNVITGIAEQTGEWNKRLAEATDRARYENLRLSIQAGFTPEQMKDSLPEIEKRLLATPSATVSEAMTAATELAGSGFKKEDISSGAALDAILKLRAGTGDFGPGASDPRDMVKGITSFLKATGSETPTAADIETMGAQFSELYDRSTVQARDLSQLAGRAATLTQFGLSREEQMSAYAALTDIQGSSKADSTLQTFVARLGAAGASQESVKALQEMGLKPSDVAISKGGLGFTDAIDKLKGGLKGKSEEDQNRLLVEMFGQEAIAGASYFTSDSGNATLKSFIDDVSTTDKYKRNVQKFQASQYADDQRYGIKNEFGNRSKPDELTWKDVNERTTTMWDGLRKDQSSTGGRIAVTAAQYLSSVGGTIAEYSGASPADVGITNTPTKYRAAAQQAVNAEEAKNLDQEGKRLSLLLRKEETTGGNPEVIAELRKQTEALLQQKKRALNANGQIEQRAQ